MSFERIGNGIVKRSTRRVLGLFIDGTGLDRATRRINRKVDMSSLVRGVTSGVSPLVARYYTLVPYEDDSRQRAFLDAVARAGLSVIVKRLPPKGVSRQVAVDVEMAADIVAFALGHSRFSVLSQYGSEAEQAPIDGSPASNSPPRTLSLRMRTPAPAASTPAPVAKPGAFEQGIQDDTKTTTNIPPPTPEERLITVVCPSRDLAYPITLARELGVDTVTADFGQFNAGDILKSAAKWIDLSDSETIWRD